MTTHITDSPEEAASYIRTGEIVAFPTETVYGLGADAFNEVAVRKIFEAKGRPSDNPLIVHVSSIDEVDALVQTRSEAGDRMMAHFFPGPLTVILEKSGMIPSAVTAGLDTVGIRMPSYPVTSDFLRRCGRPVAAPSANLSGRPSPTTWRAVVEDLDGRIACILRGGRSAVGLESTVVDCTSSPPAVLRAGAVSIERLRAVVPDISIVDPAASPIQRSPGQRHRHYAPRATVNIVDAPPAAVQPNTSYIGLDPPASEPNLVCICENVEEYAHQLFDFFRLSDASGVDTILCQRVRAEGIGLALMDRIQRASDASAHPRSQ